MRGLRCAATRRVSRAREGSTDKEHPGWRGWVQGIKYGLKFLHYRQATRANGRTLLRFRDRAISPGETTCDLSMESASAGASVPRTYACHSTWNLPCVRYLPLGHLSALPGPFFRRTHILARAQLHSVRPLPPSLPCRGSRRDEKHNAVRMSNSKVNACRGVRVVVFTHTQACDVHHA